MTTLNLDECDLFGSEGSGKQKKAWSNNCLIKLDSKFKESHKEVYAAQIASILGIPHAEYEEIDVLVDGSVKHACITPNFCSSSEELVSMSQVLSYYDFNITDAISAGNLFRAFVDMIYSFVEDNDYEGLSKSDIETALFQMVSFDYIICNSDRHLSNFGVIVDDSLHVARMCPLYDHGKSFLCRDGGLSKEKLQAEITKFKTKPFSSNPDKNIISFDYAYDLVQSLKLQEFLTKDGSFYASIIRERVKRIERKKGSAEPVHLF